MKNQVIITKSLEAINNIDMNDVESLIGKYESFYGALPVERCIEKGYFSQEAHDFVNEHFEGEYAMFYDTYMQDYVYPAVIAQYIEDGETEEEAEEMAMEYGDDGAGIWMSIQHLFAEYVYDAMEEMDEEMAQVIGDSIEAITDNLVKCEEYCSGYEWSFTEYTDDYEVVYNVLATWNTSEDVVELCIDSDDYKQPDFFNGKVSPETVAQTILDVIKKISETKSEELV